MLQLAQLLFGFLSKSTGFLRGYRTALAALASIAMIVAALSAGDYTMFAVALTQLLTIIGLRPEDVPLLHSATEETLVPDRR